METKYEDSPKRLGMKKDYHRGRHRMWDIYYYRYIPNSKYLQRLVDKSVGQSWQTVEHKIKQRLKHKDEFIVRHACEYYKPPTMLRCIDRATIEFWESRGYSILYLDENDILRKKHYVKKKRVKTPQLRHKPAENSRMEAVMKHADILLFPKETEYRFRKVEGNKVFYVNTRIWSLMYIHPDAKYLEFEYNEIQYKNTIEGIISMFKDKNISYLIIHNKTVYTNITYNKTMRE